LVYASQNKRKELIDLGYEIVELVCECGQTIQGIGIKGAEYKLAIHKLGKKHKKTMEKITEIQNKGVVISV
jgi:hypothetical protein